MAGGLDALPLFKAPVKVKSLASFVSRDLNLSSKSDVGGDTTGDVEYSKAIFRWIEFVDADEEDIGGASGSN